MNHKRAAINRADAINKLKTIVDHFDDSDDDVWQKILNVPFLLSNNTY